MSTGPAYHVMIPFYAGVGHLAMAIDSVLAQTDAHWVVVVVDDSVEAAERDAAAALVTSYGDDRIRYVANPVNLGVARNFERCTSLAIEAGAELAVLLHGDDQLEPTFVESVRTAHRAAPDAACVAPRAVVIDEHGGPVRTLPDTVKSWSWPRRDRLVGDDGLALLLRAQFFWCPAVSYRLALLPRPAWDDRWRQVMDLALYSRVLLDGGVISLESSAQYRYRRHAASLTQVQSVTLVRSEEETALVVAVAAEARRRGWRRAVRMAALRPSVRMQAALQCTLALRRRRWAIARRAAALAFGPAHRAIGPSSTT